MRPNIDFTECLKDSPRFRASLEEAETDIDMLETKLDKTVKLCHGMLEAGKVFSNANSAFIAGVKDIAGCFKEDDLLSDDQKVSVALEKFTHYLSEMQKYHNILLDQAHRSICKNLNNFVKNDIKKVKETRKHFEKISTDTDQALIRKAQAPKSKVHECEDADNVLTAMRSCFAHTSLDYVFQINVLHSKKRFDVLDTMLAYMHAQNAFFHQGYDLFADLEPFMKQVAAQLDDLSSKAAQERKEMEERHDLVRQPEENAILSVAESDRNSSDDIQMEGYLFKRTSNAFKPWVRRWFKMQSNQLVYRKRAKDHVSVMEEDLRLCTVKPAADIDRRFCFEVVSPTRNHMLQADSEAECVLWINAITAGVSKAYSRHHSEPKDETSVESRAPDSVETVVNAGQSADTWRPKSIRLMEKILEIPGNNVCCDCGATDPRWTSINLGITLCIECSGIHRSFGVHLSKVRSLNLDAWEAELIKVMSELGNNLVNRIYEAHVVETVVERATPHCPRNERESWIRAKYVDKAFIQKLPKANDKEGRASKRWGVLKRKKRSHNATDGTSTTGSTDGQVGNLNTAQAASQDSGLGGSTDVIVFGAGMSEQDSVTSSGLELDSDSASEPEADQDSRSTTSFEDMNKLDPDLLLFRAAEARNLAVMLEALAVGANPNWHNEQDSGKTPLIKAVESGSMAPVEFLLLNGAKVDMKDYKGRSPLHHATLLGNTGQVCQFLKRNANRNTLDEEGKDPLKVAVETANADIVTLLRLAKLNQEIKETDGMYSGQGDETFNAVCRDFSNMAHNTPEKLNRRQSQGPPPL